MAELHTRCLCTAARCESKLCVSQGEASMTFGPELYVVLGVSTIIACCDRRFANQREQALKHGVWL
jgi:hypothetical protein